MELMLDIVMRTPLEEGRKLLEALDKTGFDVQAAFWYNRGFDDWRLTLASEYTDLEARHKAYDCVEDALAAMRPVPLLSTGDIFIVSMDDSGVRKLRQTIHVGCGDPVQRTYYVDSEKDPYQLAFVYRML